MDITTVFGTVILGSSPGRGTLKAERIDVSLSTLGERAYRTRKPFEQILRGMMQNLQKVYWSCNDREA